MLLQLCLKKKKKKIYIKNLHSSSVSFVLLMNIGMERGGAERNGAKKKKNPQKTTGDRLVMLFSEWLHVALAYLLPCNKTATV